MKKWCKEHKKSNGDSYNLFKDGLKIYTTINPRMQLYAEEAVAKHMASLQKEFNKQPKIIQSKKPASALSGDEFTGVDAQQKIK